MPQKSETLNPEQFSPSLKKSLAGFKLSEDQALAVNILDRFNFSHKDRQALFYFFVWHETGSFGPLKEFGEIRDNPDAIVDNVLQDNKQTQRYSDFYNRYQELHPLFRLRVQKLLKRGHTVWKTAEEFDMSMESVEKIDRDDRIRDLLSQPNVLDVFRLSKLGKSYSYMEKEIGIDQGKIGRIRSKLIALKLIEPDPRGKVQSQRFEEKAKQIIELRENMNVNEIAESTVFTKEQVRSVVGRMTGARRIRVVDRRMVFERTPYYTGKGFAKIREGVKRYMRLPKNKRPERTEIARLLSEELGQEVTLQQVKSQLAWLYTHGELKKT